MGELGAVVATGSPPRIGVRGRLFAGMTGAVLGPGRGRRDDGPEDGPGRRRRRGGRLR